MDLERIIDRLLIGRGCEVFWSHVVGCAARARLADMSVGGLWTSAGVYSREVYGG